jgi:hypothetical protein
MDESPSWAELTARSQQARTDFLKTELALCFTFLKLASTEFEFGDLAHASRALQKAKTGYATIARFLPGLEDSGQRKKMGQKLALLKAAIETVQSRFGS